MRHRSTRSTNATQAFLLLSAKLIRLGLLRHRLCCHLLLHHLQLRLLRCSGGFTFSRKAVQLGLALRSDLVLTLLLSACFLLALLGS